MFACSYATHICVYIQYMCVYKLANLCFAGAVMAEWASVWLLEYDFFFTSTSVLFMLASIHCGDIPYTAVMSFRSPKSNRFSIQIPTKLCLFENMPIYMGTFNCLICYILLNRTLTTRTSAGGAWLIPHKMSVTMVAPTIEPTTTILPLPLSI